MRSEPVARDEGEQQQADPDPGAAFHRADQRSTGGGGGGGISGSGSGGGARMPLPCGWRPNLPDEADNHLIELALAGGASAIVTHNVRDVRRGELLLNDLRVLTPAECLEKLP